MTWSIKPLEGKYYGTIILDSLTGDEIKLWISDHFAKPFASEREIKNGWTPEDGHDHVESVRDYEYAQVIVDALNNYEYTKNINKG